MPEEIETDEHGNPLCKDCGEGVAPTVWNHGRGRCSRCAFKDAVPRAFWPQKLKED